MLRPNRLRMADGKRAVRGTDRKSNQRGTKKCADAKCRDVVRDETSNATRVVTRKIDNHQVNVGGTECDLR